LRPSAPSIRVTRALAALHRGGVIAYPTESVWGLGCDPANERSVMQLLALKNRPVNKGLILVASAVDQVEWLLSGLDDAQRERIGASWPGPVTWLVPHRNLVPRWITGDHDTVAVRVSAHPGVCALCKAWGGVLVSTSANPTGRAPALNQLQIRRYFGQSLDFVVPGPVGGQSRPSSIIDLLSDRTIRQ
jgi:L-threonylcarbamoyladenylate synthase